MYHIPRNIYTMPVGRPLLFAVLPLPDAVSGDAEVRDRRAVRREPHFGHRAHIGPTV